MLNKDTIIKVTNRNRGSVGYDIPDLGNLHRNFESGETKEITMEELRKLSYVPGGMTMIEDNLIIDNQEAIKEILGTVEPEYYYTEEEIKQILLNGSVEQLMDCLDFSPRGCIETIQNMAVKLKIYDTRKIEVIKEKTGFNVAKAIEIDEESKAEDGEPEINETKTRRAQPISTTKSSKYKVVS